MKMMRPFAALALALLTAVASLAQSGAAPKIVIDSPSFDFGEVKAGAPLRHTFKVKNEGKGELKILNVAPS